VNLACHQASETRANNKEAPPIFTIIESLEPLVQALSPVFTQPSFETHVQGSLGRIMCPGRRTEHGVFQTIEAETPISRKEKHPFDRFYDLPDLSPSTAACYASSASPQASACGESMALDATGRHSLSDRAGSAGLRTQCRAATRLSGKPWHSVGCEEILPHRAS